MDTELVVETSTHSINGKQAESGREGTLTIRSFLMGNFSCKAHNYAWLASDIMRSAQPDRAGVD
jgi:hypothetical protein